MSELRVAQLVETLTVGGAERLAVQIANGAAASGAASHLYVLGSAAPLAGLVSSDVTLRILGLERASIRNPFAFAVSLVRGYRTLRARLAADGVGVVQSHLPGANFWALLLQFAGVCSSIPTIHNNREFDYGDADHPLRARLRRSAYRAMMKRCPAVVAVSDLVKDSMVSELGLDARSAATMVVVPNGVPAPEPIDDDRRTALRSAYGCRGGEPLLLAAGRHTEQKNFEALIEASALLGRRDVEHRLVIAGEGPLRARHEELAAAAAADGRIVFPGVVSDLSDLMQAADVFVLPSLWEGLPLVLLEAMYAGCAVAASRIEGVVEVLDDGVTGVLTAPGDATALADALAELLEDDGRRRRLADAGRGLVASRHSFEGVVEKLMDLYGGVDRAD